MPASRVGDWYQGGRLAAFGAEASELMAGRTDRDDRPDPVHRAAQRGLRPPGDK
jgi:hypothetical protein